MGPGLLMWQQPLVRHAIIPAQRAITPAILAVPMRVIPMAAGTKSGLLSACFARLAKQAES